jgi:hypothetical protein
VLSIAPVVVWWMICKFMTGEESRRTGGRAYSVGEVSSAGYLFCFVRQSLIVIEVEKTRS